MRRELPLYVGIAAAFLMVADYFLQVPIFQALAKNVQDWVVVISGCALGLGATGLVLRHSEIVARKGKDWQFSVVLFLGLITFPLLAIFGGGNRAPSFLFVYDNLFGPIGATLFSILLFYTASAAYRTFRLKNAQAAILLFSAVLLMIGRVPIGDVMWSGFPKISDWLMKVPVSAANRGILIGGAVGTMAAGIRFLAGIERSGLDN